MTREDAILWMQVLKHSKINWVGEQAEDEDIIARCEEAEQEAFDMAIEALHREEAEAKGYCHRIKPKGEWIEKGGELVCSVCGNSVSFSRTPKGWALGKFCQSCGTRMKGGAE